MAAPALTCHYRFGGEAMAEEEDLSTRDGRKRVVLCPTCGALTWRLVQSLVKAKTDKTVRIYRCDCGEHIWDD